jgi:hypothetical protein
MRVVSCFIFVGSFLALPAGVFAQDTSFNNGPQYLLLGAPMFARSISTPTYSLAGPPLETGASSATEGLQAGAETLSVPPPNSDAPPSVDLFPIYYGNPAANAIEVSFSSKTPSKPIPSSIANEGVEQIGDLKEFHERAFGRTLADAAKSSKGRTGHATRVYTNADIERLHAGG